MNRILIACLLVGAFGGCNSDTHTIAASEFQQSCSADSDCVPVYQGTIGCCGVGGSCPNAAVNQVGYSAYESAVANRIPTCSPARPCALLTSADIAIACRAGAICSNGTCTFEQTGTDAAGAD